MTVFIMIIASMLTIMWLILLGRVAADDVMQAAQSKIYDNRAAIDKLAAGDRAGPGKQGYCSGIVRKYLKRLTEQKTCRKIAKLEREIGRLEDGKQRGLNILTMPGYVLQREIEAIGKSSFRKAMLSKSFELYGKKHANCKTAEVLAKILSYPIIGIAAALMPGAIFLSIGNTSAGAGIIAIGTTLILVFAYGIYEEPGDMVKKRQKAISRQFPNVVSKLALLVTSGMIMDRAWKETAYSREGELYMEMRKTSEELDNLVGPQAAYGNFINRCNTKETSKLASAIMQNQSKGNAEIGRLLKDMAQEVWQERRHTAKRDAEKANSKLMIPTMLLFLAILVMLMVPIAMNFSVL